MQGYHLDSALQKTGDALAAGDQRRQLSHLMQQI
jgi:hypothetical protein